MMKTLRLLLLLAALTACTAKAPLSVQVVRSEMARCPDGSWLDGREGTLKWNYTTGLELLSFLDVFDRYGDTAVFHYVDAWYDAIKASHPEFRNSVPSYRWTYEAIHVTKAILADGNPEKISCPLMLFSAETDYSVERDPQQVFISRIRNGRFISVPGSRHEIFRSQDDVLFPWWHLVVAFLNENCKHS